MVVHDQIVDSLQGFVTEVIIAEVDLQGVRDSLNLANTVVELFELAFVAHEGPVLITD